MSSKYISADHELPYEFDLLWDVKTTEQVISIANFEADCSDASPYDLVELYISHNLKMPKELEKFNVPKKVCTLCGK